MPRQEPDRYYIEAAARVLDVLELFSEHEEVRLTDAMTRLGLIKSTAFRFLYTLEKKGYIERTAGGKSYRRVRSHRIGFASISPAIPFVSEVERGITAEAAKAGLDLHIRHHQFESARLIADVEQLLQLNIRLLLCYNPDEYVSHIVADKCASAGVPVIAITFPVPGARIFGINNYRAGLAGGEGLGEQIARRWSGGPDKVVVLDIPGSSPAQQARITGMLEGLRKNVPLEPSSIVHLHCDRVVKTAEVAMGETLGRFRQARRMAVLCYNDVNALGALRALQTAGRTQDAAILSQGAVRDVRLQLRSRRGAMWCAVAHFPERFGAGLMPLISRLLRAEDVPATTFTEHVLLTPANVRRYYPED
jgi:ribose transport system substrate-binding protein